MTCGSNCVKSVLPRTISRESYHVFPIDSVYCFLPFRATFHELIAGLGSVLVKRAVALVVMEQPEETAVPGYHYEYVVFLRLPIELLSDYRTDTILFAMYVVKVHQEVEPVYPGHAQHSTSRFETSLLKS